MSTTESMKDDAVPSAEDRALVERVVDAHLHYDEYGMVADMVTEMVLAVAAYRIAAETRGEERGQARVIEMVRAEAKRMYPADGAAADRAADRVEAKLRAERGGR